MKDRVKGLFVISFITVGLSIIGIMFYLLIFYLLTAEPSYASTNAVSACSCTCEHCAMRKE